MPRSPTYPHSLGVPDDLWQRYGRSSALMRDTLWRNVPDNGEVPTAEEVAAEEQLELDSPENGEVEGPLSEEAQLFKDTVGRHPDGIRGDDLAYQICSAKGWDVDDDGTFRKVMAKANRYARQSLYRVELDGRGPRTQTFYPSP